MAGKLIRYGLLALGVVIIGFGLLITLVAPLPGILLVVLGAFLTPYTRDFITERRGSPLSTPVSAGIVLALLVAFAVAVPATDTTDDLADSSVVSEIVTTTTPADSSREVPATPSDPTLSPTLDQDNTPVRPAESADLSPPANETPQSSLTDLAAYESFLSQQGVEGAIVERDENGNILVMYAPQSGNAQQELVSIAAGYISLVSGEGETGNLDVVAYDGSTGDSEFYWRVDNQWAVSYNSGQLSDNEFWTLVRDTIVAY